MTKQNNMDGGYIIKTPSGAYYCGYNTIDPQLRKAKIYHSKRYALEAIDSLKKSKCYKDIEFALVRVKIMEDDEDDLQR